MSRTARQTGHSKQKRLASSICARVTRMTSVKGQPVFFRSSGAPASPTGSRSGARLPTRRGVGLGVICGRGNERRAPSPIVEASLTSDAGGELPGAGSVCSAFFGGCFSSAWNFLALSLLWSATWRSPARASISRLRRLAGCGMVRVRTSSVKLVPCWTKVAATASTSQSLSTPMQPTQPEALQRHPFQQVFQGGHKGRAFFFVFDVIAGKMNIAAPTRELSAGIAEAKEGIGTSKHMEHLRAIAQRLEPLQLLIDAVTPISLH